ncbi:hypothetical protein F5887DRAFT_1010670, partial [Amanita rubescens]
SDFGPLSCRIDRLMQRAFILSLFINLSFKTIFIISHLFLNGFTSILHHLEVLFTLFLDAVTASCSANSLSSLFTNLYTQYWFFLIYFHWHFKL